MRTKAQKIALVAPLAILGIAFFAFIGGEIVKLLWNWLLPPLFGFREVTFWQALGLLALSRVLFGGWSSHGSGRSRLRRRMEMTPEERERFRQRMCERWSGATDGPAAENGGT